MKVIWVNREAEYFLQRDWTDRNSLIRLEKLDFARKFAGRPITIQDDGAGLSDGELPEALLPGRRLDESVPGYGFGLPIARELADCMADRFLSPAPRSAGLRPLRLPRGPGALYCPEPGNSRRCSGHRE